MTTHTIKGFIYKYEFSDTLHFFSTDDMTGSGFILIGPHSFNYTLPANFNPVAAEVAGLEKQLADLNDKHMERVSRIKGRIKDLQCISYEPSAA